MLIEVNWNNILRVLDVRNIFYKCTECYSGMLIRVFFRHPQKFHLFLHSNVDILLHCLILFQYFVEAGAIAVRRVRKEDLRHVAKATGATAVLSLLIFK